MTLYCADETNVQDMLGAAVANCVASRIQVAIIEIAPKLKAAKEQGVIRASDSGSLQNKAQEGTP